MTTISLQKLVITENSSSFQLLKTDSQNKVEFYLFNVTNADEWQKNGTKPRLRAVGPYVYRCASWHIRMGHLVTVPLNVLTYSLYMSSRRVK